MLAGRPGSTSRGWMPQTRDQRANASATLARYASRAMDGTYASTRHVIALCGQRGRDVARPIGASRVWCPQYE